MAKAMKRRGATRKPVRKQRQAIAWNVLLRNIFMLTGLVLFATSIVWLNQDDTLPILHVTVDGKFEHVNKGKLVKSVMPYVSGSFISVDVAKLREAGESAPWVKQIQVQRRWPDSLHLIVEEQNAIAAWGQYALVNKEGELFYPAKKTFPKGLVQLDGPEGTNIMITKRYVSMKDKLLKVGLGIKQLKIDKRRSWLLKLNNDITVKLGRADSEQRLNRFIAVYKAGLNQFNTKINTVDMRYTNGLAVNWKSGSQSDLNGAV